MNESEDSVPEGDAVGSLDANNAGDNSAAALDYCNAKLPINQQTRTATHQLNGAQPFTSSALVSKTFPSTKENDLLNDDDISRTRSGAIRKITSKRRVRTTSPSTVQIPPTTSAPPPQQTPLSTANNGNFGANIDSQIPVMRPQDSEANGNNSSQNITASNLFFAPAASSSTVFEMQRNYLPSNTLRPPMFAVGSKTATSGNEITTANFLNSSAVSSTYTTAPTLSFSHAVADATNLLNPSSVSAAHNIVTGNPNYPNQSAAPAAYFSQTQNPYTSLYSAYPTTIPSIYAHAPQLSAVSTAFPYNVPNNSSLCFFANNQQILPRQQLMTSSLPVTVNSNCAATAPVNSPHTFLQNSTADYTLSNTHVAARHAISKDLPIFTGKPDEWPIFITNYMQSTERCGFTDQENLIRLQKCLKGAALEAVRGKLMMPATVPFAIETLRMLYGRPEIIHHSLQRKLKQEQPVRKDKLDTLINFALSVQNYRATMQAMGLGDYLNDPILLNELIDKLPSDLKLDWGRYRIAFGRVDIVIFDTWLFNLATCATQVTSHVPTTTINTNEETKGYRKQSKERIFVHDVMDNKTNVNANSNECPKCTKQHRLTECEDFTSLKTDDRWKFIREQRLCLRCFKKHLLRRCHSKRRCGVGGCKMPHNPLLHSRSAQNPLNEKTVENNKEKIITTTRQSSDSQSILFHVREKKKTLFRYIPVTLFGNNRSVKTFALIDEGAACTLVENEVAAALGLEGPTEELCLQWTGEITQKENSSKVVTFHIASRESNARKFQLRNVRTVSTLDLPEQTLEKSEINSCVEFKNIPILPYTAAKARILIGLDNANICVPLEVIENGVDGLIAAKCRIGWSMYGRQCGNSSKSLRLMHLCPCNKNNLMDGMLKNYFSLESIGVTNTNNCLRSKDDERALRLMEATSKYIESEKIWETGLLWKYDQITLPDSLPMARRRLYCLEAKMTRSPELKTFLNDKMKDYEKKRYIRKLKQDEITSGGKSWYIPIFTVTNKNKNKSRIVWNAAAEVNGVSLNSALLKGPDLLKSLVGILLRFRENPIAMTGDIREMFHQVRVTNADQVSQKFLWRYGDTNKSIDIYTMTVMTFGASCSPSLANYIKNKNAERFRKIYPKAVDAIIENTFVDDWLQSVDTEKEMIEMAKLVRNIHQDGGFEMRNWLSNSKRVLTVLKGDIEQQSKCIQDPVDQYEKVLGMWWVPTSDVFTFKQNFSPDVFDDTIAPTKRKILRVVMTIFDPLGLLAFYVIYAKVLLQEIWRTGVTWDEPICAEEERKWWVWCKLLPDISQVRVPRCYDFVSSSINIQMHVFVDASINAYAALVYLRAEHGGIAKCSLVATKTRVAPLKPVSIPKLELLAAVLGLRLAKFVNTELSVRIARRVFWSDSKNVLYWIRSDARKYQQFVALRIGEILEGSHVKEWRWVSSSENVADEGTKWSESLKFDAGSRWFVGPDFLRKDEADWPVMDFKNTAEKPEFLYHIKEKEPIVSTLAANPTRFSKWEKYRNTQRNVLKFLRLIRKTPYPTKRIENLVNLKDINNVENVIIQKCQEEEYEKEIKSLRCGKHVQRKSPIYKSSPYLDDFGVLRVKGRIDSIEGVATSVKRPIILPRKHPVTFLIAEFYHRKYHHHHSEIVVNEMRQRFQINGLRALAENVSKKCQICKNRSAKPNYPEMGNVPSERLAVFTRPFHFTGVDYFGPFEVVVGRRREKRWGVLFTCMTIRAVHIEITPSLSTDSFLLVFKQFISRRGVPQRILSDNATNFRGASRMLLSEVEKISSGELESKYPEIEWRFIPPASPHMGGSWERMVRSVKSVLMDILPRNSLPEEVLRAALADVENIINSRPLTYVPLNSSDSEALTPNHFLIGNSSGVRERALPDASGVALSKSFRITSALANQFWRRWLREYLPGLTRRAKWHECVVSHIAIGDVVIIVDENAKRNSWQKGIVVDVHRAKDNQVRSAVVKTNSGLLTRPAVKLAKLDVKK